MRTLLDRLGVAVIVRRYEVLLLGT
jgi:hypothetical protein